MCALERVDKMKTTKRKRKRDCYLKKYHGWERREMKKPMHVGGKNVVKKRGEGKKARLWGISNGRGLGGENKVGERE